MVELSKCRLCKTTPMIIVADDCCCTEQSCPLHMIPMSGEQWLTLMGQGDPLAWFVEVQTMTGELAGKLCWARNGSTPPKYGNNHRALYLHPTPERMDQGEAVGWMDDEGNLHATIESAAFGKRPITPLYARSAPAADDGVLRDAVIPFNVPICRKEDMSPNGRLQIIKDMDGDIHVMVLSSNSFGRIEETASIEFCTAIAGGGGSPETFKALHELMAAMMRDNSDPRRDGRKFRLDCDSAMEEQQDAN